MTELVITDPKFLRAFDRKFRRRGLRPLNNIWIHGAQAYSFRGRSPYGPPINDDEYIWVMLRAMEEGLI